VSLSLHNYADGEEVGTWIIEDRYYHLNGVEIPRDQFEGMMIQGKRVTPWYICTISIDAMSREISSSREISLPLTRSRIPDEKILAKKKRFE
jgi:hypothetical protein